MFIFLFVKSCLEIKNNKKNNKILILFTKKYLFYKISSRKNSSIFFIIEPKNSKYSYYLLEKKANATKMKLDNFRNRWSMFDNFITSLYYITFFVKRFLLFHHPNNSIYAELRIFQNYIF